MIDRIEIFGIIHKVDNQIKREIDQIACKHGLTGIQSFFLKCIYDNAENGDVFQRDLEKMFDIRRSSVSTMISCVEKKGYIKRESIPTDKRINKIVLTEEGRKKYEEVDADLKEYKHQLLATFELPFIFRALSGILWVELIFMIGFIFCLVWQWCSIRMTVRSARIQTMGMTHLEHELKKPLATMISVVNGILEGKDSVLCPRDTTKLTMVKARLMKMADITDTMLTSLKTSVLMINREVIDLKFEMEMTTEMFSLIRPYARVGYRIAEGLEYPCLDKIYFNYVVVNLVDNAIKYGGTHPVVKVDFYTIGDNYVLTVEDNGMGIAPKDQKQIFKQFYRVKNQQVTQTTGFGLGLTFVHKVVCAYGGSIRLESELGIGSKFTITIPQ